MLARMPVPKEIGAQLLRHGRSTEVQPKYYDRYACLHEKEEALVQ
jgi:hypothetical protein